MQCDFETFSLEKLRARWSDVWGYEPHCRMGAIMMIKSLKFKQWEDDIGATKPEYHARLAKIIKSYKRDPKHFDDVCKALKVGTRIERIYKGKAHSLLVTPQGFEYQGKIYKSLSKIANEITGKRWNGWVFFGLKKAGAS